MTYYNVGFKYVGPRVNILGDDDDPATLAADKALREAEKMLSDALAAADIDFRHAYAWPDGSLYKFVRTERSQTDLISDIELALKPHAARIGIGEVLAIDSAHDPQKSDVRTVAEYFEKT